MKRLVKIIKSMAPNFACVDSALVELDKYPEISHGDNWNPVRVGLQFLKTFLVYIPKWSNTDEVVHQQLGDLVNRIEVAFADAGSDIQYSMIQEGGGEGRGGDDVRANLLEKIEGFKPRIKETYEYLSEYAFGSHHQSPVTDFHVWRLFYHSIKRNYQDIFYYRFSEGSLLTIQMNTLSQTLRDLKCLPSLLYGTSNQLVMMKDLWAHVGGVAIYSARLMFLCWIADVEALEDESSNTTVGQDLTSMLSFLQKKMKPFSPQHVDMYLKAMMKSSSMHNNKDSVYNFLLTKRFVQILLPDRKDILDGITNWVVSAFLRTFCVTLEDHAEEDVELSSEIINETLRAGLSLLIIFLLDSSIPLDGHGQDAEDIVELKWITSDIGVASSKAVALDCSSNSQGCEDGLALVQLLQNIEILKVEVVLMLQRDSTMKWNNNPLREQFQSVHKGMLFLRNFLNSLEVSTGEQKRIYNHVQVLVRKAEYSYHSWLANHMTEDRVRHAIELLVDVKLLKTEAFLIELVMKYRPSSLSLNDQIEKLNEGLELLRKFLSGSPEENQSDEWKLLIFAHIEEVAKEAVSLICCFFHSNDQVKENIIKDFVSNLQEKINVPKEEVREIYFQVRSSSSLAFPKTRGFGFVDFFFENLRRLMKYKADSIDSMKHEIGLALKELESLGSLLQGIEEKCNKNIRR